ncbi:MAG TPA: fibronectin type III domain-containing protein [Acidobacteriota bacterium]|nr:fibronectin type III domain-containing protein [Acidobacteriota bacterium]
MDAMRFFGKARSVLISLLSGLLVFGGLQLMAGDAMLEWDASISPNVSGYRIYIGQSSGNYGSFRDAGNQTSFTVTGLGPGTWYFAATAYDNMGNESGYSNEVSKTISSVAPPPDTTPPVISTVVSSNITTSSAVISWLTDQPSDSIVEYGLTTAYGSSTSLSITHVTSHSRLLAGLTASTVYNYRVKSKNAAGDLSVSGNHTFVTAAPVSTPLPPAPDPAPDPVPDPVPDPKPDPQPDTTPPVISNVAGSNITTTGATITWSTNVAADTQVEYGTTTAYGSSTAIGTSMVTSHTMALNGLMPGTTYHYRAKSKDAGGNLAVSVNHSFVTASVVTHESAMPFFSSAQNTLGLTSMFGIDLTNSGSEPAAASVVLMDKTGGIVAGGDLYNPVNVELEKKAQLFDLDYSVFGKGVSDLTSDGWIKVSATSADVKGYFLYFDDKYGGEQTFLAGAAFAETPAMDFVFAEIQPEGFNRVGIINNNPLSALVELYLVGADGTVRAGTDRTIGPHAVLSADIFRELFAGLTPAATDYVRVKSDAGLLSFAIVRQNSADIAILNGQDSATGSTTLYAPHYVFGDRYRTSLSLVNLDPAAGTVGIRLINDGGAQLGQDRTVTIPGNGKLFIDGPEFFMPGGAEGAVSGYVEIVSDGVRLAGIAAFYDRDRRSFYSAVALTAELQTSALFNHVISNDLYYSHLVVANPGDADARLTSRLYSRDGRIIDIRQETVAAGGRKALVLTELFTTLEGTEHEGGYIRLSSDNPIASLMQLGTANLSTLTIIPPQAAADGEDNAHDGQTNPGNGAATGRPNPSTYLNAIVDFFMAGRK